MDHQDLVGTPAACQRVQEGLVSCPCRWGIGIWVGPVCSEIEIAAPGTEVVALLVTGVVVRVPSVVPWGGAGPGGRVGPSEDPSGALVQVPEPQVQAGVVDRQEGPWVGSQGVG